jgi:glycosyltransferase involved in cell wall biosynthesis
MNEKISVIIPTKNRMQDVIRCLESISLQSMLPDEVVIVDSSDTENLKSALDLFDNLNIKYIHDIEASLTRAENIGIENSIGDIIIILDDDVILDKSHIKEFMHVFDIYPAEKIGGVTGNVMSNQPKSIIKRFLGFGMQVFATMFFITRYGNGKFQLSGMPTTIRKDVDKITECEFLYGYNMAFRRDVISEFKFDENFHGYSWGEDDDIAYRVSRKYQDFYTPFAKIVHTGSPSMRGNKYAEMKMAIENHYYLFKKNLPQDFKHKFAFWWSVVGLFALEGMTTVVRGDSSGIRGLVSGMSSIIKRNQQGR